MLINNKDYSVFCFEEIVAGISEELWADKATTYKADQMGKAEYIIRSYWFEYSETKISFFHSIIPPTQSKSFHRAKIMRRCTVL